MVQPKRAQLATLRDGMQVESEQISITRLPPLFATLE